MTGRREPGLAGAAPQPVAVPSSARLDAPSPPAYAARRQTNSAATGARGAGLRGWPDRPRRGRPRRRPSNLIGVMPAQG
ncbi:MAG: hypothetical protein AVDCRST_MAG19-4402 [uncultured Thermomicrobiales bacterium]|uniref:Uncharacterized protein n=1 Tax=uncultured Thermomicrobiales bacterium TaxID=1645740 RepID=A0A6J4VMD1_9BACT|nr:MAG: hypothetical protein AVDCRST_MAG19-4402 [uncultured Thermomicrobiales bacterium]